jgi:hypothetical protein
MFNQKKGMVGYVIVAASLVLWLVVILVWYNTQPTSELDLTENKNLFVALWWTIVCALCAFIGLRMEKIKATQ